MTTGFVFHESFLSHEMPAGHPERPERISAIRRHLTRHGLLERMTEHAPEPAERSLIELAHDADLVDQLEAIDRAGGGRIDLDTSMGPHSLDAALRASQGTVDAAANVLDGTWDSAFVCARPPGHHAESRRAMGFCLTNHVAVAARWAVTSGRCERAVILDWDAHHGNGSQDIFWADDRVLYVSLHQYPWYPGTGDATERGSGAGAGYTVNVPVPSGTAEDSFEEAFEEIIEPAVTAFAPGLVFVSAGFDAHHHDPLCMLRLRAGAYFRFTQRVMAWGAGAVCVLEGGYDLDALTWSTAATVSALLGEREPAGVPSEELGSLPSLPEARAWVERARDLQRAAPLR